MQLRIYTKRDIRKFPQLHEPKGPLPAVIVYCAGVLSFLELSFLNSALLSVSCNGFPPDSSSFSLPVPWVSCNGFPLSNSSKSCSSFLQASSLGTFLPLERSSKSPSWKTCLLPRSPSRSPSLHSVTLLSSTALRIEPSSLGNC